MCGALVVVVSARWVIRHRRTASHRALRYIWSISPVREEDFREERRRILRARRRRASAALLHEMCLFFNLTVWRREWRHPVPQRLDPDPPIIIPSDSSGDEEEQPPTDHQVAEVVDLSESFDELPDLNLPQLPLLHLVLQQAFVQQKLNRAILNNYNEINKLNENTVLTIERI